MALTVNLRHLTGRDLHLEGEIPVDELDINDMDELIRVVGGLGYVLDVERHERGLLLQGQLSLALQCVCARCLASFHQDLRLTHWCALLPWEGEDALVVRNDCVDLTPYLREDIVLALPQRPLCDADCNGLPNRVSVGSGEAQPKPSGHGSSAWAGLDRLRF